MALVKMGGRRLVGLFLLLWMAVTVSGQEDLMNQFVHDIISTFNLTLPTVLYDSDEPPQICYENTPERRVLCLLATEEEQTLSIDHHDIGMYVQGSSHLTAFIKLKLEFMLKDQNRQYNKDNDCVAYLVRQEK